MSRARTVLVTALLLAGIVLTFAGANHPLGLGLFLPYAVVGAVLAVRRPRNPIGWVLIATGWSFFAGTVWPIGRAQDFQNGTASWFALLLIWATSWAWFSGVAWWVTLMVIFPAGRIPGGRWRPIALAGLALAWVGVAVGSLAPTLGYNTAGLNGTIDVPNPLVSGLGMGAAGLLQPAPGIGATMVLIALLGAAASVVVRFRRAAGAERQQLLWFVAGLLVVTFTVPLGLVENLIWGDAVPDIAFVPVIVPFVFLPMAIGVAVLRYRLYDIDTIINRAVLYAAVTAAILAIFGLANLALQNVLAGWTGGHSDLLTGFAGLAIGSQYGRLRGLVRPLVDRFLPSRAMLALLFTDIVGSTERLVELGDERWRNLLGRYRAVVRQELGRFGGREVDTAGDGFFATFERPAPAVACASAMRSAVGAIGLELRTGIHMGECEMRGEKVSGVAVHAAARVMAAAGSGEILISRTVRDAIEASEVATIDRGSHELKGVPGSWQLFAVAAQ